jgi:hypothetical protein
MSLEPSATTTAFHMFLFLSAGDEVEPRFKLHPAGMSGTKEIEEIKGIKEKKEMCTKEENCWSANNDVLHSE